MSLTNTKFYANDRFFRDESADSLEEQVILPILNPVELGSDMSELLVELAQTDYYAELFQNAFGSSEVTRDGISKAMSQFVRSMVSYQSKYDSAFDENGDSNFEEVLTEQENHGRKLFHGVGRCAFCHTSEAQVATQAHNNGLDEVTVDSGAGNATFKSASLRNVGEREFFMHDGRFSSLEEVVDFYSDDIQAHPDLDFRLRDTAKDNEPLKLNFSDEEKDALVAFLETLTDYEFLNDPKFSNPFVLPCDFDHDENCTVSDLNLLLASGNIVEGVDIEDDANGFAQFDLNGDSTINQQDVREWLKIAATANSETNYLPGDANLDGSVDEADLDALGSNLFQEVGTWNSGDFNGDGLVDGSDFNIWNDSASAQSNPPDAPVGESTVPEPTSRTQLACLLVLAVAILRRRSAPRLVR